MGLTKNVQSIWERVHVLLRVCKYITGCTTGRCSCRRKEKECGKGCQCLNCTNINTVHDKDTEIDELVIEESQGHNKEINDEVEELMDWVFGEDAHSRVSNNIDSEEEDISMYKHICNWSYFVLIKFVCIYCNIYISGLYMLYYSCYIN